jgi:tetraacyldisaccharide 4'-kinase
MVSEAPPFWWKQGTDLRALALYPFSLVYAAVARRRLLNAPRQRFDLPVLCVGNLTVGGSGKTPVAIALAKAAKRMRRTPGFLSRGHGGTVTQPQLVDPHHDIARHVGDEPMLLARHAITAVTPDRAAGAALLAAEGCDFIIMDDGFQSQRIRIDYALIVVDSRRGIGNGFVIPAGPMRGGLVDQMRYCDGVLKMGQGPNAERVIRHAAKAGRPFFEADIVAKPLPEIEGRRCLAFAGIGDPHKFFETVAQLGGEVVLSRSFADHHAYNDFDAQELVSSADAQGLELVTTAKDAVRLEHGSQAMKALRDRVRIVEVEATFQLEKSARALVEETMAAWRRRRLEK